MQNDMMLILIFIILNILFILLAYLIKDKEDREKNKR